MTRPRRPVAAFRSAARVVVAVTRSVGQTGHHVQECRLIGSVVVVQPRYLFLIFLGKCTILNILDVHVQGSTLRHVRPTLSSKR